MYALGYDTPLGASDRVELDLKYRSQSYTQRLITTVSGTRELRHDDRWFPAAALIHSVHPELSLRADYHFEGRRSNDVRKNFQAHRFIVGATWQW